MGIYLQKKIAQEFIVAQEGHYITYVAHAQNTFYKYVQVNKKQYSKMR